MLRLPPAAGPITASLFEHLGGAGGPIAAIPPEPDALGDRDLQLALYVANELHYGAVEGVDDGLEWDPKISALRTALGQGMVNRVLAECEQPAPV